LKFLFMCDHCRRIGWDSEEIAEHELACPFNPCLRSCCSCKNRGHTGYPFGDRDNCLAGVKNWQEIETRVLPCDKWEQKPY
jgi:hypothetical protein